MNITFVNGNFIYNFIIIRVYYGSIDSKAQISRIQYSGRNKRGITYVSKNKGYLNREKKKKKILWIQVFRRRIINQRSIKATIEVCSALLDQWFRIKCQCFVLLATILLNLSLNSHPLSSPIPSVICSDCSSLALLLLSFVLFGTFRSIDFAVDTR